MLQGQEDLRVKVEWMAAQNMMQSQQLSKLQDQLSKFWALPEQFELMQKSLLAQEAALGPFAAMFPTPPDRGQSLAELQSQVAELWEDWRGGDDVDPEYKGARAIAERFKQQEQLLQAATKQVTELTAHVHAVCSDFVFKTQHFWETLYLYISTMSYSNNEKVYYYNYSFHIRNNKQL